jgi:hypothetical protein
LIYFPEKTIDEALHEYQSHNTQHWRHDYFNSDNGGYLVTHRQRIAHSHASKNETEKFSKEVAMAMVYTQNGFRIELLEEVPRIPSPDVTINGIFADLKRLSSHNNIVHEAKNAIYKQGADIVLFEFDKETEGIYKQLEVLKIKEIDVYYFFTGREHHVFKL